MRISIGVGKRALPVAAALIVMASYGSPVWAQVQQPETAEKASGREHQVRKGDTLWDLAELYLSNPFLWGLIYDANRGLVVNPDLIYPDNRLLIPDGSFLAAPGDLSAEFAEAAARFAPDRTRFYRDGSAAGAGTYVPPTVLEGVEAESYVVQPNEFLAAPWLAERSALRVIGSVVRIKGHGGDRDKISQSVHPADRVYLRYQGRTAPEVGDRLLLVREGRRLRGWGRVVEPAAIAEVEEVAKDVVLVAIQQQFGRIGPGDLALPLTSLPELSGSPEPVAEGPTATLLGFVDEQSLYDYSDLGFVDLGERDGVAIGDEFEVYLPERSAGGFNAPRLPTEMIARLRVVRVDERTATVRPIKFTQEKLRPGLQVQLVGKMP
jgi:hypothetical protein